MYDSIQDLLVCPAGEELRRRNHSRTRRHYGYKAPQAACAERPLKTKCTGAKGRSIEKRGVRVEIRRPESDFSLGRKGRVSSILSYPCEAC